MIVGTAYMPSVICDKTGISEAIYRVPTLELMNRVIV